jgi:regulator of protease activity HflC (stomatin/prohibitin superfamily)
MNLITDLINWIEKGFKWWVIVLPWERGLRIRAGKHITLLTEGVYFKIPILDQVFIRTIRIRFMGLPMQTLTTRDGKTLTINASVGYSIQDVQKLYNTIYHPESTIANLALGAISKYVSSNILDNCSQDDIEREAVALLQQTDYGLHELSFKITGYAIVRTHRLLMDHAWFPSEPDEKSAR